MPRLPTEVVLNIRKAREAAVLAVETYNRPATAFRSAGYIVLMVVAFTALFHAIFLRKRIRPYHRRRGSRRYERIEGDYKTWELAECLRQHYADQNTPARKNLEFFIGLRNKIEHRFLPELDTEIFGECQALLMNFEELLAAEFGSKHTLIGGLPLRAPVLENTCTGATDRHAWSGEAAPSISSGIRHHISFGVIR